MDMVEIVARAISNARDGFTEAAPSLVSDYDRDLARAAMLAMRDGITEEMLNTLHREVLIEVRPDERECSIINERHVWESLIDTALHPNDSSGAVDGERG